MLAPQNFLIRSPPSIAGAQPGEVEQLMHEDAREFGLCAVESDPAFTDEGAGVDGAVTVAQPGCGFDAGRRAAHRQPRQQRPRPALVTRL